MAMVLETEMATETETATELGSVTAVVMARGSALELAMASAMDQGLDHWRGFADRSA